MTIRTNEASVASTPSCEDIIWSITTWMTSKVNDDMLFELKDAEEKVIITMARDLHDTHSGTDIVLDRLLEHFDSPRAAADTKQCVHLSAMRSALKSLIKAYTRFSQLAPEVRVAA